VVGFAETAFRKLLLSPDHSVLVMDVLIPVKQLTNGATVAQIDAGTVTYYHLELPRHDVVLAEGLPTETYLETGGRSAFANGGDAMQLHPDFAPNATNAGLIWDAFGYAPLTVSGSPVDRARAMLAAQALILGYRGDSAPPLQHRHVLITNRTS
jgi:collagen type I/II/III/V/XI/XXIV/XXVII alpha